MFAAFEEVGVREFEERGEDIRVRDPLLRQMAVRIEFGGDQYAGADDGAHALKQIALAIVIALRDHGAMQAEHDGIDRQRGAQLAEDFVAQVLIGLALQQSAGLRPGRRAFDQREALLGRAPA